MPIALLLGIKREAIGATFSVGREPSLAIIGEKYGMNSPEGRGVLAEYLTGTLFGALFIALVAGFIASLGIFDPRSLAMAAGVGSRITSYNVCYTKLLRTYSSNTFFNFSLYDWV